MERDVQHLGLFLFYFLRWYLSVVCKEIFENCRDIFFSENIILVNKVFNILLLDSCMDVVKKCLYDVFAFTLNPRLFCVCLACLHSFHDCSCSCNHEW